jgi:hypothetical protein
METTRCAVGEALLLRKISLPSSPPSKKMPCEQRERESTTKAEIDQAQVTINREGGKLRERAYKREFSEVAETSEACLNIKTTSQEFLERLS